MGSVVRALALILAAGATLLLALRLASSGAEATRDEALVDAAIESVAAPAELAAVESERATTSRQPLAADRAGEGARDAVALAELAVYVRASLDREGVFGLRAQVQRDGEPLTERRLVDRSYAEDECEVPRTNAEGEVVFGVAASVAYLLRVWMEGRPDVQIERRIAPIAAGDIQSEELELDLPLDLLVRGALRDEQTHRPIAGARVRLHLPEVRLDEDGDDDEASRWGHTLALVESDAEGRFELRYPSWRKAQLAVEAEGFGPRFALLDEERSRAERDVVLDLARGAELVVVVRDAFAGVAGADVSVLCEYAESLVSKASSWEESYAHCEWSQPTDASGRARFEGLPPGTALSVAAVSGGRALGLGYDECVRFKPGERRELVLVLAGTAAITGKLTDARDGSPIAGARISLLQGGSEEPELVQGWERVFDSALTDESGSYAFEGVPAGDWRVAIASEQPHRTDADVWWLPPIAQPVQLQEGERRELDLRVDVGLFLRGVVLDADRRPIADAWVCADPLELRGASHTSTSESGEFHVGPLVPGAYRLYAVVGDRYTRSVVADPLDEAPIELLMDRGGEVRGFLAVSGVPAPRDACVRLLRRRDDSRRATAPPSDRSVWLVESEHETEFAFTGVLAASYDLCAETDRGEFAFLRRLEVKADETLEGLALELRRGGIVALTYTREVEAVDVEALLDGELVGSAWADRDFAPELVVPPGDLVLRIMDLETERVQERRLHAEVGETIRVELP